MTLEETTISLMKDGVIIDKTIGETITDKTIETEKIIEGLTPDRWYRNRSASIDRSRNYSSDNSRNRDRNRQMGATKS